MNYLSSQQLLEPRQVHRSVLWASDCWCVKRQSPGWSPGLASRWAPGAPGQGPEPLNEPSLLPGQAAVRGEGQPRACPPRSWPHLLTLCSPTRATSRQHQHLRSPHVLLAPHPINCLPLPASLESSSHPAHGPGPSSHRASAAATPAMAPSLSLSAGISLRSLEPWLKAPGGGPLSPQARCAPPPSPPSTSPERVQAPVSLQS